MVLTGLFPIFFPPFSFLIRFVAHTHTRERENISQERETAKKEENENENRSEKGKYMYICVLDQINFRTYLVWIHGISSDVAFWRRTHTHFGFRQCVCNTYNIRGQPFGSDVSHASQISAKHSERASEFGNGEKNRKEGPRAATAAKRSLFDIAFWNPKIHLFARFGAFGVISFIPCVGNDGIFTNGTHRDQMKIYTFCERMAK